MSWGGSRGRRFPSPSPSASAPGEQRLIVVWAPGQTVVVAGGLLAMADMTADIHLTTCIVRLINHDPGDDD